MAQRLAGLVLLLLAGMAGCASSPTAEAAPPAPSEVLSLTLSAHAFQGPGAREVWPVRVTSSGAVTFGMSPPLRTGDRIVEAVVNASGDGFVGISAYELRRTTAAGIDSLLVAGAAPVPNQAWQGIILGVPDTLLGADESITLLITASGPGLALGNVTFTYDHPTL